MSQNISRRNFLKKTSAATAGVTAASVTPFSSVFASESKVSKVVVATDKECIKNTIEIQANRVQDMVDHAIMELTGNKNKSKAYEALFPKPITPTTTIAIKKNSCSGGFSYNFMLDALKNGLASMLDGTFPAANVTITIGGEINNANPKFSISGIEFTILNPWVESDWIINCPVCWSHIYEFGVTMGLKNMMSAVGERANLPLLHSYDPRDEVLPWISLLNNQALFKEKLVLVLMDAITGRAKSGGPGGSPDFAAHSVIASKDIVACDYQGTRILIKNGLSTGRINSALKIFDLAAKAPYNLGTNNPDQMDCKKIMPPLWEPEIIGIKDTIHKQNTLSLMDVSINPYHSQVLFSFNLLKGKNVALAIFDSKGRNIYTYSNQFTRRIMWPMENLQGMKVPPGIYAYQINVDDQKMQGKITLKK